MCFVVHEDLGSGFVHYVVDQVICGQSPLAVRFHQRITAHALRHVLLRHFALLLIVLVFW